MTTTIFRAPKLKVGIYQNQQHIEVALLDPQRQPHFYRINSSELAQLAPLLRQQFASTISNKARFFYISCLEPHLLWQKHLLLPRVAPHERYRQVKLILKQQLPSDESQILFDFIATPIPHNNTRQYIDYVQIFAAKRQNVLRCCERLAPLKLNALDFYAHALLRAFVYVSQAAVDESSLFIYQDSQPNAEKLVLLQQYPDRLIQSYEKKLSLPALLQLFFQHAPPNQIQRCVIYAAPSAVQAARSILPAQVELITIDPAQYPYFIALGCALWQTQHWQTKGFVNGN